MINYYTNEEKILAYVLKRIDSEASRFTIREELAMALRAYSACYDNAGRDAMTRALFCEEAKEDA